MASYVNVPGLSGLKDAAKAFKENVSPLDVLLGVGVGLVAGAVAKKFVALKTSVSVGADGVAKPASFNAASGAGKFVSEYSDSLGAALAGLALFAVQKGNKRAAGHLVGCGAAAVVPLVVNQVPGLLKHVPGLNGYVINPYGMIADDGAYGMIANDNAYGMIANDGAYGSSYVSLPGSMGELRSLSHQIGEEADEYMV